MGRYSTQYADEGKVLIDWFLDYVRQYPFEASNERHNLAWILCNDFLKVHCSSLTGQSELANNAHSKYTIYDGSYTDEEEILIWAVPSALAVIFGVNLRRMIAEMKERRRERPKNNPDVFNIGNVDFPYRVGAGSSQWSQKHIMQPFRLDS